MVRLLRSEAVDGVAPALTVDPFVLRLWCVEIHRSARRHGVDDEDIRWAVEHCLVVDDVGDDESPRRWLMPGADHSGRMLELVVLVLDDAREIVIHAMPMRAKYERLMEGER